MQVIEKAVEILQLMSDHPEEKFWRVTDVGKGLNMNVSTTHRLMQSLKNSGIINQDEETKKYSLGINFIYYGDMVREMNLPGIIIYPLMERLYEEFGETVFVTIKDQDNCVVIERINSFHQLRFIKRIGESYKLHETPCGKVILAYLTEELFKRVLERIMRNDTCNIEELSNEIQRIREKKYLIEQIPSMDATVFSAPIFSLEGNFIASLSTVIPRCRLTEELSNKIVGFLNNIVEEFMVVQ